MYCRLSYVSRGDLPLKTLVLYIYQPRATIQYNQQFICNLFLWQLVPAAKLVLRWKLVFFTFFVDFERRYLTIIHVKYLLWGVVFVIHLSFVFTCAGFVCKRHGYVLAVEILILSWGCARCGSCIAQRVAWVCTRTKLVTFAGQQHDNVALAHPMTSGPCVWQHCG
jgi:hypothetical protein